MRPLTSHAHTQNEAMRQYSKWKRGLEERFENVKTQRKTRCYKKKNLPRRAVSVRVSDTRRPGIPRALLSGLSELFVSNPLRGGVFRSSCFPDMYSCFSSSFLKAGVGIGDCADCVSG